MDTMACPVGVPINPDLLYLFLNFECVTIQLKPLQQYCHMVLQSNPEGTTERVCINRVCSY